MYLSTPQVSVAPLRIGLHRIGKSLLRRTEISSCRGLGHHVGGKVICSSTIMKRFEVCLSVLERNLGALGSNHGCRREVLPPTSICQDLERLGNCQAHQGV